MSPAWTAAALAALAAAADLAWSATPRPSAARRLLRAAPAGALAVALRLADAPPLPATALLAFAVADAIAADGREPGLGGWTLSLLALLLLAAALWELASPARLAREPWRLALAVGVLASGAAVVWRRREAPRGELDGLAPVSVLLLGVAAAGAGAQPTPALALPFALAVALSAAAAFAKLGRPATLGLGRLERALRSAAPAALALPLLPPF